MPIKYGLFFAMTLSLFTQQSDKYLFQPLLDSLKPKPGSPFQIESWIMNRQEKARIFHKIMKGRDSTYEKDILEFINRSPNAKEKVERFFNLAMYVADEYYLDGAKPRRELGISLFSKGLAVLQGIPDHDKFEEITWHAVIAVLAAKMGNMELAKKHKAAEKKLSSEKGYEGGHFPALDEADFASYDKIPN